MNNISNLWLTYFIVILFIVFQTLVKSSLVSYCQAKWTEWMRKWITETTGSPIELVLKRKFYLLLNFHFLTTYLSQEIKLELQNPRKFAQYLCKSTTDKFDYKIRQNWMSFIFYQPISRWGGAFKVLLRKTCYYDPWIKSQMILSWKKYSRSHKNSHTFV